MPFSSLSRKPVVQMIAGVTASGKSALALEMALQNNGVIINADSQQVYQGLAILTAQPSHEEKLAVPHELYGDTPPQQAMTAAHWTANALNAIETAVTAGKLPIVVGGTGLYIQALCKGLSPIPVVDARFREEAMRLLQQHGKSAFHVLLTLHDAPLAARLHPHDTQRLLRGMEIFLGTGTPLSVWQQVAPTPPPYTFVTQLLLPERAELYQRINTRFLTMVKAGAIEEVAALVALKLPAILPAMKAVGVPEIAAYVRGEIALETAIEKAQQASRNYAKRQYTWFRNQKL